MRIQFDAVDYQQNSSGAWLMLKVRNLHDAASALEEIENGKRYVAELKQYKKHRSPDANAYAWALLDKLAAKLRHPKTEIYKMLVKEIGGNSTIVCAETMLWKHSPESGSATASVGWRRTTGKQTGRLHQCHPVHRQQPV